METFNDGICDIYREIDEELAKLNERPIRFGDKIVGATRFYAAKQVQEKISRVIKILLNEQIEPEQDVIVINKKRYAISQIQHKKDKKPAISEISLEFLGMFKVDK